MFSASFSCSLMGRSLIDELHRGKGGGSERKRERCWIEERKDRQKGGKVLIPHVRWWVYQREEDVGKRKGGRDQDKSEKRDS